MSIIITILIYPITVDEVITYIVKNTIKMVIVKNV